MLLETRELGVPRIQIVTAIFWPSFLAASAATIIFFSLFDPFALLACEGEAPVSRTAAYSLGFFGFWLLTAIASMLTTYFLKPTAQA